MNKPGIALGLAVMMFATAAQAMSVADFLSLAMRVPHNPSAVLSADFRRLREEVRASFGTLRSDNATARASGLAPPNCMPDRIALSPQEVLARLESIPAGCRSISVTHAMREWMAERYPCRPSGPRTAQSGFL